MRIDLCDPAERAARAIDGHDVRAVMHNGCAHVVAKNQFVPVNRRADPRYASGPAVVVGYLSGPEEASRIATNRVQVSRPIQIIHGMPSDGWSGGHVAPGRKLPFGDELMHVCSADLPLRRLTSGVVQIASGYSPASETRRRLGDNAAVDCDHR